MVEIDKEKTQQILVEELKISPEKVERALADFPPLDDRFKPAIDKWLEDRAVIDLEVEGFSIKEVMDNTTHPFPIAIRELNKLLDENVSEEEKTTLRVKFKTPVYFE